MSELMDDLGYACAQFSNADDALLHIMHHVSSVGLVITDKNMAGQIDGGELSLRLRAHYPALPIILTSGRQLNVVEFPDIELLPKPWSLEVLAALVNRLMRANPSLDR